MRCIYRNKQMCVCICHYASASICVYFCVCVETDLDTHDILGNYPVLEVYFLSIEKFILETSPSQKVK